MKKILSLILSLGVCTPGFATNYYLSNNGSDSNSGTSPSDAWQTIDQLNSILYQPGDSIFFECGSIFRGEIVVTSGGNDAAKIYFGKYGSGNLPVISGAEPVSGWNLYLGNMYRAAFTQTPAHLFADDKQMTIARYPNSGYLIHQDGVGNIGFIDTSLTQPNDFWNGATIRMRTSDRRWEVNTVDSFSNDTIIFSSANYNSIGGYFGYFFDNLFSLIDTANEWFYDSANQELYFIAPGNADPSSMNTGASVYDYGMWIENGSYFTIENIRFEKQKTSGIFVEQSCLNISISNCGFRLQDKTGVLISAGSTDCSVVQNNFADINGIALSANNAHRANISLNVIRKIGLIPGYGFYISVDNMDGIECFNSDSVTISQNVIDSIGSIGIFCGMNNSLISKNILSYCLLNLNSLGGIYLYGALTHASVFKNNIVLHTIGSTAGEPVTDLNAAGIYADQSATENIFDSNTVAYATSGILVSNNSSDNILRHNVVYGCTESQLKFVEGNLQGSTIGNIVRSNTFFSLNEIADVSKMTSDFNSFNPASCDSNYYFNPYAYHVVKKELAQSGIEFPIYRTLHQWQNESGQDENSHSTFFYRSRFKVTDTLNDNLITNSFFTNNFDGWAYRSPDFMQMLLDNSVTLDFGCLKLSFLYALPDSHGYVFFTGFPLDSSKLYQLHLSNYSIKEGNTEIKIKDIVNDYLYVVTPQAFPFDSSRHDYNTIFQPFKSCSNCQLALTLSGIDSIVWLDNITLFPVSAILETPEKKSRLFVNTMDAITTFDLGDSVFYNLDQVQVTGSITLQPYSSSILIFDSSLILSANNEAMNQSMKIFPNPVSRGSTLNLVLPQTNNEVQISISDLQGEKLLNQFFKTKSNSIGLEVPPFLSQGIYFITVKENNRLWSGKIVVM
ncbi:MAG TPA: right-handed parallel beta-helix repeat-containing protein [Chitinophagales bacterium]|nr:right-handed parallel beta-helix repeat-containing protein [Chitinophagales bacterium]